MYTIIVCMCERIPQLSKMASFCYLPNVTIVFSSHSRSCKILHIIFELAMQRMKHTGRGIGQNDEAFLNCAFLADLPNSA